MEKKSPELLAFSEPPQKKNQKTSLKWEEIYVVIAA